MDVERVRHFFVWLSRISHCRGFGIQSPSDYHLVRCVINEHWPYYQYEQMGSEDGWLQRKLGCLYFRLSNWRQPQTVVDADMLSCWQAGCRKAQVVATANGRIELMRLVVADGQAADVTALFDRVDDQSVIVVEGINRNRQIWRTVIADERVRVSFNLYYCGILLFDKKRAKKNYVINF